MIPLPHIFDHHPIHKFIGYRGRQAQTRGSKGKGHRTKRSVSFAILFPGAFQTGLSNEHHLPAFRIHLIVDRQYHRLFQESYPLAFLPSLLLLSPLPPKETAAASKGFFRKSQILELSLPSASTDKKVVPSPKPSFFY